MNRIFTYALASLVSVAIAGAASAAEVRYDRDPSVDTSGWTTWSFQGPEPSTSPGPGGEITPAEARIRRALTAGFEARGYRQVAAGEADFLVDYAATADRAVRVDGTWGGPLRRGLRVDTETRGVLLVDVRERASGRLAWRGAVSDALASD